VRVLFFNNGTGTQPHWVFSLNIVGGNTTGAQQTRNTSHSGDAEQDWGGLVSSFTISLFFLLIFCTSSSLSPSPYFHWRTSKVHHCCILWSKMGTQLIKCRQDFRQMLLSFRTYIHGLFSFFLFNLIFLLLFWAVPLTCSILLVFWILKVFLFLDDN